MKKIWTHEQLGTFTYHKSCLRWIGTCSLPNFKIFNWDSRSKPSGKYELAFESTDGKEPSSEAANVASLVIANQDKLVSLIAPNLWEDFNGGGRNSGIWWHGDMDQVADNFGYDDRPRPKGPQDLIPVLGFSGITIHEADDNFETPLAELQFDAVFEMEHGVGLLTDGRAILGAGYSGDTFPYESV